MKAQAKVKSHNRQQGLVITVRTVVSVVPVHTKEVMRNRYMDLIDGWLSVAGLQAHVNHV